jgi:NAD(P)-dependent dehydrogenase (short-subunit alcohol dehydrogenase family)
MKTAIVTGATGNLGRAVVKQFIDEGYKVFGTLMPGEAVDSPMEKLPVDLLNEAAAQRAVEAIGSIDVAVLTVGGFALGDIEATSSSDILKQYRLNFETAYNIARPVFLRMKKQGGGKIFFIGSKPGMDGKNGKGMTAYSFAKSLVFRLAELVNEEGAAHNIVASVIVPGTIDTPQNRKAMPDADFNKWVKAEEIAGLASFFSSDQARSVREPVIKMF